MSPTPENLIGYTDDGKIFMLVNSTYEGKPVQTAIQWNLKDALEVANAIKQAVDGIRSKADGGNGKNPN